MHKYAKNMQKNAQICNNMQGLGTLQNRQKYANYMHKYAQICNICNQGFHMQNMHEYALPTLLMAVRKDLNLKCQRRARAVTRP